MIEGLLPVLLLVGVATLVVATGALRSSRRAEGLGEDRFELLRDQQDRLELLHEERKILVAELERETSERQKFMESLRGADPRMIEAPAREREEHLEVQRRAELREQERARLEKELRRLEVELERERQGHQEILRRAEGLEQEQRSGIQREAARLRKERQRLAEELESRGEELVEVQRRAERQEQELARLEGELQRSQASNSRERAVARDGAVESGISRPWWRRPLPVVGLLVGVLIAWFVSLTVALSMLAQ